MSKGGDAPPPPDPWSTAAAQTQANQQTASYNAALNRINSTTPLGSHTYSVDGTDPNTGAPIYSENISLSPEQQAIYDQQTGQAIQSGQVSQSLLDQIKGQYSQPVSTDGLPALSGGVDTSGLPTVPGASDINGYRQQSQDALYARNTQYLDPQFSQGEEQLRSRLANQGVVEGSEAYNNAMQNFDLQKQKAYSDAREGAIAGGSADAQNMFNMGSQARSQLYGEQLANNQTNNQARQQGEQELFALREQPLSELNALRTGNSAQLPQFQGTSQVQTNPADIAGAINGQYQGQLGIYNANQQTANANTGAAASIVSAIAIAY